MLTDKAFLLTVMLNPEGRQVGYAYKGGRNGQMGFYLFSVAARMVLPPCFARIKVLRNTPPMVVCPLAILKQWHQETTLTERVTKTFSEGPYTLATQAHDSLGLASSTIYKC